MANAQTEQPKPCAKGKLMAWDVTVPDTFAESHLSSTTAEQGMATKQAADNNTAKYRGLEKTHIVFPAKTAEHGTSCHGTGVRNQEMHQCHQRKHQRNHFPV